MSASEPARDEPDDVHVIGQERLDGPIRLVPYDPEWPRMYEREAARVRGVLGERVLLLEHIGSTSVPGLPAKPIIDMLLVVDDPGDEQTYVRALEAAGYVLTVREPDWYEHRLLKGPERRGRSDQGASNERDHEDPERRGRSDEGASNERDHEGQNADVNLHVHPPSSPEIERNLRFRDRLRDDGEERELYLRTKQGLARRTWRYVQEYADAKGPVIEQIIARATSSPRRP